MIFGRSKWQRVIELLLEIAIPPVSLVNFIIADAIDRGFYAFKVSNDLRHACREALILANYPLKFHVR
ncbi:TPA: hypothetical protein L9L97_000540 [Klebsiella pneumoniae]|nr:hypothetical protein [Enterobacter hormaechei subsp. xiangfangensis]HBR1564519.1 hypothetical protein [Klebsiella pneumoniae]